GRLRYTFARFPTPPGVRIPQDSTFSAATEAHTNRLCQRARIPWGELSYQILARCVDNSRSIVFPKRPQQSRASAALCRGKYAEDTQPKVRATEKQMRDTLTSTVADNRDATMHCD